MDKQFSIAIDMDDVLCGTTEKMLTIFNETYNEEFTPNDLAKVGKEEKITNEMIEFILEEFNKPGFTRDLAVKKDAIEVVESLNEKYNVYIATAAMEVPGTFFDKYSWLEEHFPFLNPHYFIFCGNKQVVNADYLIDDTIKQLENFNGTGILYTAKLNEGIQVPFTRVDNWSQVYGHFIDGFDSRIDETKQRHIEKYHQLMKKSDTIL